MTKKSEAVSILVVGLVVILSVGLTALYGVNQSHKLTQCNKDLITNLSARSQYSSDIQNLDNQRNAALLGALQNLTNPDKEVRLRAVQNLTKQYQDAEGEQKQLTARRDSIKLPKLDDCLE